MSINILLQKKNENLRKIGEITKKMRAELSGENHENLLSLIDQRCRYIDEIREIDSSVSLPTNLSDPEIKGEVDIMRVLLQDIIKQDEGLKENLKTEMDAVSEKIKGAIEAKKVIMGYLSFTNPGAVLVKYSV